MSNHGWSPKPLKGINTSGIFSHDDEKVYKSANTPNRWAEQRATDGTPHTIPGPSALVPPPAGPKLTLDGLDKAIAGDMAPHKEAEDYDQAERVVKAYFSVYASLEKGDVAGAIAAAQGVKKPSVKGASDKAIQDDDEAEEIEKKK